MDRIQKNYIIKDLTNKMVFIVGPRQSGKTWLARKVAEHYKQPVYLNYDATEDRRIIQDEAWLDTTDLLILDELHKMPDWKNFLKGVYDTKPNSMHILVTGSARLDVYRELGDSLAGRYFLHHLLPLSAAELKQLGKKVELTQLITRSGFPEPYLAENLIEAERWRMQYINSLLGTDVLEFDNIKNLSALKTVFELLRHRVGSPISYSSIAEDVNISSTTVKRYIDIFKALYIVFTIHPYSKNIARSLLKEPKIYFFDTGLVKGNSGASFENLVALSLLKSLYGQKDYLAKPYELKYLRTKDQREVDFAIVCDDKIETLVEAKTSDKDISPELRYFCDNYNLTGIQVVHKLKHEYQQNNITVKRAENFLETLFL